MQCRHKQVWVNIYISSRHICACEELKDKRPTDGSAYESIAVEEQSALLLTAVEETAWTAQPSQSKLALKYIALFLGLFIAVQYRISATLIASRSMRRHLVHYFSYCI